MTAPNEKRTQIFKDLSPFYIKTSYRMIESVENPFLLFLLLPGFRLDGRILDLFGRSIR